MKRFLTVVFLLGNGVAFADGSGFYVNANVGANTADNYQFAYNGNVGYMLNSYLGIEGGYTGANGSFWDVAVKGVLPVPIVDIYGKLGMSYINNYGSTSGAALYGVGVSIPIFPMLQLNFEDYVIDNYNAQNFLMGGLQFKF